MAFKMAVFTGVSNYFQSVYYAFEWSFELLHCILFRDDTKIKK